MKQSELFKYANLYLWSDVHPYEIVKWCTDKKIMVRSMDYEPLEQGKLKWATGGFGSHSENQNEQKWKYISNPTLSTYACRLHKNGQWKSIFGQHVLAEVPFKSHDYNF